MAKQETKEKCTCSRFPTFAVIFLIWGIVWLLNDLGVFTINIPWLPVTLIVIGIGWIINHYIRCSCRQ